MQDKLSKEHPEYFKNSKAFIENVFKGVYIKSDYGDGTVLYVDRVDLQMKYQFYVIDTATNVPYKRKQAGFENEDSTAHTWRTEFASTKEVIQANQFLNSDKIQKLAAEDEHTYIKAELAAALALLPEQAQEEIFRYYFLRQPQRVIGVHIGRTRSTAGRHIQLALQRLRKEMEVSRYE